MSQTNIPDRRHPDAENLVTADHLVSRAVSDLRSENRLVGLGAETATGRELPDRLALASQSDARAKQERDTAYTLNGIVQIDDAYLGGGTDWRESRTRLGKQSPLCCRSVAR